MTAVLNGKKIFGAGRFWGIQNITSPTPARFLIPQDMTLTMKRNVKTLFGENQFAEDVSGGEMDVSGKVTYGTTNARIFANLMLGSSTTNNSSIMESDNESCTLVSHVATVTNSATWTTDLGVVNVTTGVRYQCVASAPAAGISYTVAAGVYTFNASETGTVFKISYLYTVSTSGELLAMANQPQGKVGDFSSVYVLPWTNAANVVEQDVITLNACIASDAEISTKGGDYGKPTFSFTASVDQSGNLGTMSFAEAA